MTDNPVLDADILEKHILALFDVRHLRLTPFHLEKQILLDYPEIPKKSVRSTIRRLVHKGELLYVTEYSSTYLIPNPVTTTRNLIERLQGKILGGSSALGKPQLLLSDGVSFGSGDHPTTHLCIEGLSIALNHLLKSGSKRQMTALDVGTGNGILAMAAIAFGCSKVVALDTDAVACIEAKKNISANGMEKSVSLYTGTLDAIGNKRFDVIMANLRMPTLKSFFPQMCSLAELSNVMILSGFRPGESGPLKILAPELKKRELWAAQKKEWAAVVLG